MFSKGVGRFKARFEQNEFKVNEVARAFVDIDNSECKTKIKHIKIALKRKILLYSEKKYKITHSKTVAEEMFPGIDKKERTP